MARLSRSQVIASVVACAFFMQNLDGTVVTTALPQIGAALGVSPVTLNIIVTAYFLSAAVFIPISGWLADRFGVRTTFQVAIAAFVVASFAAGFSNNLWELTAARIVQAAAGAMIVPVGRFALLREVTKGELVKTIAFLTVPTQVGSLIGPVIGGAIATYASWRWIFFINIPIGILGIFLAGRFIENFREPEQRRFDWLGFVLSGTSLFSLLYGIDAITHEDANPWSIVAFVVAGLLLGWFCVRHLRRSPVPLLDLSLFKVPTFTTTLWGGLLVRVSWGGLPFVLSLLFQYVFGMNAATSGLMLCATAVGSVLIRMAAPGILSRIGFRALLVWNGVLSVLSMLVLGLLNASTPYYVVFITLLIGGVFQALQVTSLNTMAYVDIDIRHMSSATAISQLTIRLGKAFGVAAAAVFINLSLTLRGDTSLSQVDMLVGIVGVAALSACAMPFFLRLRSDAGADVTGHLS